MRLHKMQATGVAVVWMLLQMVSAYSFMGNVPGDSLFLSRGKRSEGTQPAQSCNKEEVDNLAKSAKELCSYIGNVNNYIASVNTRQPLSFPHSNNRFGFQDILSHYNTDLKTAQNNCHPWRNGDNILGSLEEMVKTAQEFEPKFSKGSEDNQLRIKFILENHEDIGEIEAKIAALEEDIREAKEAAKLTSVPTILTHLENVIKSKEEQINSTIKDHELVQVRRELEELIQFLEFVKNNTSEVELMTENVRTKINNFKENVVQDASAFKRHLTQAQEAIRQLQQERQSNNQELTNIQRDKDNLSRKIAAERAQITVLNGKIRQAQNELQNIENSISRSMRRTRRKKKWGRIFRVAVPVVGWFAGSHIVRAAKRKERMLADQKRAFINEHNKMVQNIQAQIARGTQDISHFQNRISNHHERRRQLETELESFGVFESILKHAESEVKSILPSITNAITGVSIMRDTFDVVKLNLEDTIEKAKVSKTEAEIRNMKYFIYNEISEMKCKWNHAYEKIVPLGQCNLYQQRSLKIGGQISFSTEHGGFFIIK